MSDIYIVNTVETVENGDDGARRKWNGRLKMFSFFFSTQKVRGSCFDLRSRSRLVEKKNPRCRDTIRCRRAYIQICPPLGLMSKGILKKLFPSPMRPFCTRFAKFLFRFIGIVFLFFLKLVFNTYFVIYIGRSISRQVLAERFRNSLAVAKRPGGVGEARETY